MVVADVSKTMMSGVLIFAPTHWDVARIFGLGGLISADV